MQLRAFLVDRCGTAGKQRKQIGCCNLGIRIEFLDDVWQLIRFGTHQATDQPFDACRFLLPGFTPPAVRAGIDRHDSRYKIQPQ